MLPALSAAKGSKVTAELAARLVRQAGVEKCLAVVENNAGKSLNVIKP